jgi:hypothetical protein
MKLQVQYARPGDLGHETAGSVRWDAVKPTFHAVPPTPILHATDGQVAGGVIDVANGVSEVRAALRSVENYS